MGSWGPSRDGQTHRRQTLQNLDNLWGEALWDKPENCSPLLPLQIRRNPAVPADTRAHESSPSACAVSHMSTGNNAIILPPTSTLLRDSPGHYPSTETAQF